MSDMRKMNEMRKTSEMRKMRKMSDMRKMSEMRLWKVFSWTDGISFKRPSNPPMTLMFLS